MQATSEAIAHLVLYLDSGCRERWPKQAPVVNDVALPFDEFQHIPGYTVVVLFFPIMRSRRLQHSGYYQLPYRLANWGVLLVHATALTPDELGGRLFDLISYNFEPKCASHGSFIAGLSRFVDLSTS
ncbi:hypothetical protein PGTUg99_034732 [Puccinia graminis f. sp. tritici]|uniref:Uncharacterized protein n=1 Tax=Puccinia graminis f. sp. tritici TaxID=56615 RepID=A0A5B0QVU5_PUCGR|nr:hypothetical protein PGTUg99_034732 [Puccinia graminis f. sp. tritici]